MLATSGASFFIIIIFILSFLLMCCYCSGKEMTTHILCWRKRNTGIWIWLYTCSAIWYTEPQVSTRWISLTVLLKEVTRLARIQCCMQCVSVIQGNAYRVPQQAGHFSLLVLPTDPLTTDWALLGRHPLWSRNRLGMCSLKKQKQNKKTHKTNKTKSTRTSISKLSERAPQSETCNTFHHWEICA